MFFFISAKFSFEFIGFTFMTLKLTPLFSVAINLLIVLKSMFDGSNAIVYIGGQKNYSLSTQFLKRIA